MWYIKYDVYNTEYWNLQIKFVFEILKPLKPSVYPKIFEYFNMIFVFICMIYDMPISLWYIELSSLNLLSLVPQISSESKRLSVLTGALLFHMTSPNRSLHLLCTISKNTYVQYLSVCRCCFFSLSLFLSFSALEIIYKWRIAWLIYSKSPRTQVNMRKIRVNFIISSHVRLFALALCPSLSPSVRLSVQRKEEKKTIITADWYPALWWFDCQYIFLVSVTVSGQVSLSLSLVMCHPYTIESKWHLGDLVNWAAAQTAEEL